MSVERYSLSLRVLHWLMALMIIGMLIGGFLMDFVPDEYAGLVYGLHKSFGVTALLLVVVRIIVRLTSYIPPLPAAISGMDRKLAKIGHGVLYLFMILMPLSGFVMSSAHPKRFGVEFFGIKLPDLPASEYWSHLGHEIHEILPWAFILLIIVHVVAVIKHRREGPDADVMPRMR